MPEISITREDHGGEGRYVARLAGADGLAELTFTHSGPGVISANHTGAPASLQGTGVAGALVDHLVADARQNGFRIIPRCPYIRARYLKHPEWQDVMTVAPGEVPAPEGDCP